MDKPKIINNINNNNNTSKKNNISVNFNSVKKLLQYEILDYLQDTKIRILRELKIRKIYLYALKRRRDGLLQARGQKTRDLLIQKKKEEDKIENEQFIINFKKQMGRGCGYSNSLCSLEDKIN